MFVNANALDLLATFDNPFIIYYFGPILYTAMY